MLLKIGDVIPVAFVSTIDETKVLLKGNPAGGLVHVQLRRFSDCPICNTHLRKYGKTLDASKNHPLIEVVVFHTDQVILKEQYALAPWVTRFKFVADPKRVLYKALGAETGDKSIFASVKDWNFPEVQAQLGLKSSNQVEVFQKPADFLVDSSNGKIKGVKYGQHVNDQWTFEETLVLTA